MLGGSSGLSLNEGSRCARDRAAAAGDGGPESRKGHPPPTPRRASWRYAAPGMDVEATHSRAWQALGRRRALRGVTESAGGLRSEQHTMIRNKLSPAGPAVQAALNAGGQPFLRCGLAARGLNSRLDCRCGEPTKIPMRYGLTHGWISRYPFRTGRVHKHRCPSDQRYTDVEQLQTWQPPPFLSRIRAPGLEQPTLFELKCKRNTDLITPVQDGGTLVVCLSQHWKGSIVLLVEDVATPVLGCSFSDRTWLSATLHADCDLRSDDEAPADALCRSHRRLLDTPSPCCRLVPGTSLHRTAGQPPLSVGRLGSERRARRLARRPRRCQSRTTCTAACRAPRLRPRRPLDNSRPPWRRLYARRPARAAATSVGDAARRLCCGPGRGQQLSIGLSGCAVTVAPAASSHASGSSSKRHSRRATDGQQPRGVRRARRGSEISTGRGLALATLGGCRDRAPFPVIRFPKPSARTLARAGQPRSAARLRGSAGRGDHGRRRHGCAGVRGRRAQPGGLPAGAHPQLQHHRARRSRCVAPAPACELGSSPAGLHSYQREMTVWRPELCSVLEPVI